MNHVLAILGLTVFLAVAICVVLNASAHDEPPEPVCHVDPMARVKLLTHCYSQLKIGLDDGYAARLCAAYINECQGPGFIECLRKYN